MIDESHVHYFATGETATPGGGCGEGSAVKPEAEPGNLCIYTTESAPTINSGQVLISDPALPGFTGGAGAVGASLGILVAGGGAGTEGGLGYAIGTWAVTAP